MRPHAKPAFAYTVTFAKERAALAKHLRRRDRAIPPKTDDNLLLASWNLTNFGVQARRSVHLRLMADIIRRFDVVAVQEVADDIAHLGALLRCLGARWNALYTDASGNDERLAILYDATRVRPAGLTAELAMRGYEQRRIHIEGVDVEGGFQGFNRNPFIVTFTAGKLRFALVNVHLYWSNVGVRELETEALWRWAKARVKKKFPPNDDIILMGDFNIPRAEPGDRLYDIATACGVAFPKHTTDLVGTNLAGDADYDQLAFFPNKTDRDFTGKMGVVDFDNALFADLYERNEAQFYKYVRYYMADHRPLWAEFQR